MLPIVQWCTFYYLAVLCTLVHRLRIFLHVEIQTRTMLLIFVIFLTFVEFIYLYCVVNATNYLFI